MEPKCRITRKAKLVTVNELNDIVCAAMTDFTKTDALYLDEAHEFSIYSVLTPLVCQPLRFPTSPYDKLHGAESVVVQCIIFAIYGTDAMFVMGNLSGTLDNYQKRINKLKKILLKGIKSKWKYDPNIAFKIK